MVSEPRLVLVGCVKSKVSHRAAAKDLYASPLWSRRRGYAESTGMPWAILSAEHGMVDPESILEPYDRYLGKESASYRRRWSEDVSRQVLARLRELGLRAVEIHAGAAYVDNGLAARLNAQGVDVVLPLKGLSFGQQLGWY
jgi:hypothetical protein